VGGHSKGCIIAVNGPLATCEVEQDQEVLQNEVAYVNCQGAPLKAEVIRIRDGRSTCRSSRVQPAWWWETR